MQLYCSPLERIEQRRPAFRPARCSGRGDEVENWGRGERPPDTVEILDRSAHRPSFLSNVAQPELATNTSAFAQIHAEPLPSGLTSRRTIPHGSVRSSDNRAEALGRVPCSP